MRCAVVDGALPLLLVGHLLSPHHDIVEVHDLLNHASGTLHGAAHLRILVPLSCEDVTRLIDALALAATTAKLELSFIGAAFRGAVKLPSAGGSVVHILTFVRGAVLVAHVPAAVPQAALP